MIVRLMGEGQWRIDESVRQRLNELDEESLAALERSDEGALDAKLEEMWALVKSQGEQLAAEDLSPSDVVIPPTDLTLEETRQLFESEGLIPDLPSGDRETVSARPPLCSGAAAAGIAGRRPHRGRRKGQSWHGPTTPKRPAEGRAQRPRGRQDCDPGGRSPRRSRVILTRA